MSVVTESTAVRLRSLLVEEQRGILLVFWAPWHTRSEELAEEASRLAAKYPAELVAFCVNVDHDVEVAMAFGMRVLPLCLLFEQGREVARTASSVSPSNLQEWLWRNGLTRSAMPAEFRVAQHGYHCGAFHGDEALRLKLCRHLLELTARGQVRHVRIPCWDGQTGSIIGALGGSLRPDIAEEHSGLPYSFLSALEFLSLEWTPAEVRAILEPIQPGLELDSVATQLMYRVFADSMADWRSLLGDPAIDRQRQLWLRAIERHLAGIPVPQVEWDSILVELGQQRSMPKDPFRSVQDCVIDMLGLLSPPPPHDSDLWVNLFSLHGIYLEYILIGHELEWSREEFAFEGIRASWFMGREALEPGGKFTTERLALASIDWHEAMGKAQADYDERLHEASGQLPLVTLRVRSMLIELIAAQKDVQAGLAT